MNETIMDTKALPDILFKLITTEKVRVKETSGVVELVPIKGNTDCTIGLRGLFVNCPEMSVDKFLERKLADKGLEL